MNRLHRVIPGLVLCSLWGILPASEEVPNHRIFYRNDKRAPLTKIDIVFLGAGRNQESPSQNGLAKTASRLIWESAKKQGHLDQLAVLGTELNIFVNATSLTISVSTLSKNCGESIKIVHNLIHNLEFSESDLTDVKKREADDYRNDLRNRVYYFMRTFALAQTTGIKKLRSLKALNNLSLEDMRQYCDRLLKTDVVFFKVISDLDLPEVTNMLHPITGERQTGGFAHALAHSATDHTSGPVAFVFKHYSHLKSVFCYWLIPYGSIDEENYIPTMISLTLGRYGARGLLYRYFREELGLAYSASCKYQSLEGIRFLEIFADPQLHNSEELIKKMSEFIQELPDNPRFWEGLKALRENRNVAYAHYHEELTPQRSLDREVYKAIHNPPTRKGGSASVTEAEVRSFLEKFFVSQNMIMIFLGPEDHIIKILNTYMPGVNIQVESVESLIE